MGNNKTKLLRPNINNLLPFIEHISLRDSSLKKLTVDLEGEMTQEIW